MIVGVISLALLSVLAVRGQEVGTEYGPVRGQTIPVNLSDGTYQVTSFWAIPYARPPIGNLRFEPPQKHPGWSSTFVADELPLLCMQASAGLIYLTHPGWNRYNENCLTLNIFKPEVAAPGSLPVLVWFHGGGYVGGGSIQYPGHFLAAKDTVVVVVNYRLGVFGFASTPDKAIKGNMGMHDQILALQFVRDNIANFGGDPSRVTIFGQSAGASSAALLMVSPLSRGLYSQAILESGAESNVWSINTPGQEPDNYIYQVAENANCTTETIPLMLECLRSLREAELQRADSIVCTPGYFCQGFAPIVDGPGGFLPDMPLTLRENLSPEDTVPIIAGHCKDDGALYTIYFIPEANNGGFTRDEFQFLLRTRLVDIFAPKINDSENYENAYQAVDWYYSPWPKVDDLEENRQAFNRLITDAAFGYAWDRNAKINSQHKPTYTYIQSFRSLNASSFIPEWMGVPHNGELPYVWGYGLLLTNQAVRDDSEIVFDIIGWTPEDGTYAEYVQTLWTNFAKFGNPTPEPVKAPFNDTLTTWPLYSVDDNLKVLDLNGEIIVKEKYRQRDYAFFIDYMSYVVKNPIRDAQEENDSPKPRHSPIQMTSAQFQREITRTVVDAVTTRFPGEFDEMIEKILRENEQY